MSTCASSRINARCTSTLKKKPVHLVSRFWSRCVSKLRYLYEFDMYLGKKENTEYGLGKLVAFEAAVEWDRQTEIVMDIMITSVKWNLLNGYSENQ